MHKFFLTIVFILIVQRLIELYIARRNARFIIAIGGYEVAQEHYKHIVLLHIFFFLSLITEVFWRNTNIPSWWPITFSVFIFTQALRIWCLNSLGRFWNTRIFVVPGASVVRKGPYRFLRHPNYLVVIIELLVIPLTFGAYFTAFVVSSINLLLLNTRIHQEEQALADVNGYDCEMELTPRFLPFSRKE